MINNFFKEKNYYGYWPIVKMNLEDKCYGLPAGIYLDDPKSFLPGSEEKKLILLMVISKKKISTDINFCKELRSRATDHWGMSQ